VNCADALKMLVKWGCGAQKGAGARICPDARARREQFTVNCRCYADDAGRLSLRQLEQGEREERYGCGKYPVAIRSVVSRSAISLDVIDFPISRRGFSP